MVSIESSQRPTLSKHVTPLCEITNHEFIRSIRASRNWPWTALALLCVGNRWSPGVQVIYRKNTYKGFLRPRICWKTADNLRTGQAWSLIDLTKGLPDEIIHTKELSDEATTYVKKKLRGKIIGVQYQNSPNVESTTHRDSRELVYK